MNPFEQTPAIDPAALYRQRDGVFAVDLLTAAVVEFDVITRLADAPCDLQAVCGLLGTSHRPTDVMLSLLAAHDLIQKDGDVFSVTERGREHLMTESQWWVRDYFASLQERPVARDMARVLRTGKAASWSSSGDLDNWHEAFLNAEKAGPLPVAEYSAILMHSTQGRCYGQGEIRQFLDAAGFDVLRFADTTADRGVFIARKR